MTRTFQRFVRFARLTRREREAAARRRAYKGRERLVATIAELRAQNRLLRKALARKYFRAWR